MGEQKINDIAIVESFFDTLFFTGQNYWVNDFSKVGPEYTIYKEEPPQLGKGRFMALINISGTTYHIYMYHSFMLVFSYEQQAEGEYKIFGYVYEDKNTMISQLKKMTLLMMDEL